MEKTTHAKITVNEETGDADARVLNFLREEPPIGRRSLLRIDMSEAIERIDHEEIKRLLSDDNQEPTLPMTFDDGHTIHPPTDPPRSA